MTEANSFKTRLLNVFAVILNLATMFFLLIVLQAFVHVLVFEGTFERGFGLLLFAAAGLGVVAVANYLSFGNVTVWNRLRGRQVSSDAA